MLRLRLLISFVALLTLLRCTQFVKVYRIKRCSTINYHPGTSRYVSLRQNSLEIYFWY